MLRDTLQPGGCAWDGTLGNGHDMLFLTQCVGSHGFVWGCDIQKSALQTSQERLQREGIAPESYALVLCSHGQMDKVIDRTLQAAVFNLGYLPGSNKELITQPTSTLRALDIALKKLKGGGMLSVMCYPGHVGGEEESQAVLAWFESQRGEKSGLRRPNHGRKTPFLLFLNK